MAITSRGNCPASRNPRPNAIAASSTTYATPGRCGPKQQQPGPRPGCLVGAGQLDDRYLALLQRHGDTTDAAAQIQTLRSLGIQAELCTVGRIEQLIAQLRLGIPVPVGWLHKGPVNAPSGGGHWSLVVGWDPIRRAVLMHDPNGEADLVGGGYVSTAIGSGIGLRRDDPAFCGYCICCVCFV